MAARACLSFATTTFFMLVLYFSVAIVDGDLCPVFKIKNAYHAHLLNIFKNSPV